MRITKINANGNDFLIFHAFLSKNRAKLAQRLCDRNKGLGADGLIVLLPADNTLDLGLKADIKWEFYNSDGSDAFMCGNGSRAAGFYAYSNDLADKNIKLLTKAGIIELSVDKNNVSTSLTEHKTLQKDACFENLKFNIYDTGVPHVVLKNQEFNLSLAQKLRAKFNANVNFYTQKENKLFVQTFERGVEAQTLACGTGMAACFVDSGLEKTSIFPKSNDEILVFYKNSKITIKANVQKVFDTFVDLENQ